MGPSSWHRTGSVALAQKPSVDDGKSPLLLVTQAACSCRSHGCFCVLSSIYIFHINLQSVCVRSQSYQRVCLYVCMNPSGIGSCSGQQAGVELDQRVFVNPSCILVLAYPCSTCTRCISVGLLNIRVKACTLSIHIPSSPACRNEVECLLADAMNWHDYVTYNMGHMLHANTVFLLDCFPSVIPGAESRALGVIAGLYD